MTTPAPTEPIDRTGLTLGLTAYLSWGLFPLYFALLSSIGTFEIVAHRALWGLVFCLIALPLLGRWDSFRALMRDRKTAGLLSLAGYLVAANWTVYVFGVTTGRTLDAALGYFINPIVTVLLAVLVLKERLRPLQWAAIIFGALAVAVLVIAYGEVPYIALGLAASFGLYSLVKKQVGPKAGPLPGMAVETAAILPVAAGYLIVLAWTGAITASIAEPVTLALLIGSGPLTAIVLMIFAGAASRLPLAALGLLQYLAPAMQMAIGVLVFSEPLPPERLAGFVLVWIAIALLIVDSLRSARRRPQPRAHPSS
ncbi:EamA family transporter RarD [Bowdeniella nasicola]|uniref:EamA family transporter RarD n=1 Tax=Bowdeniella nasicola TaxID=208480 RepID=UPI001C9E2FC1|nr:EamA family transporter RarD [Bowdeniella nasicola]